MMFKLRTIIRLTLLVLALCLGKTSWAHDFVKTEGQYLVLKGTRQQFVGIRLADDVWIENNKSASTLKASLKLLRETGFSVVAVGVEPANVRFVAPLMRLAEKQGLRVALQLRLNRWGEISDFATAMRLWEKEVKLTQSPTLFAWEFLGGDMERIQQYADFLKRADTNHLVGVVSDGLADELNETYDYEGCMSTLSDYFTLGLHPLKWQWTSGDRTYDALPNTYLKATEYLDQHLRLAEKHGQVLVVSASDYPRDRNLFEPGTATDYRLSFCHFLLSQMRNSETPLNLVYLGEYKQHYQPEDLPERLRMYTYPQDVEYLKALGERIKTLHN